ncbi:hypothetical protein EVAR_55351_1 [Eumeta japonica]|uniref:Uncharacterized protein n=1 Tax=Eumeta variegata TaxID=151549 RepID=A0A4C1YHT7_EUMVA|nr:hypothetical protein EVAR_55351_1 [Eumeta japonica]
MQPNESIQEEQQQIAVQPQEIHQLSTCSPTEVMDNFYNIENHEGDKGDEKEGSDSPDFLEANGSRVSAFERLGPISQPKKPKLTINLLFSKDQPVREVVDETKQEIKEVSPERYIPVHERRELLLSIDEMVIKYLPLWPWKKQHFTKLIARLRERKDIIYFLYSMPERQKLNP